MHEREPVREVFLVLDVEAVHKQGDEVGPALYVDVAEQRVDDADVGRGEHVEILRGAEVEREVLVLRLELAPHDAVLREKERLEDRFLRLPDCAEFQRVGKTDGFDRDQRDRGEVLLQVFIVVRGHHALSARLVEILHIDQAPGRDYLVRKVAVQNRFPAALKRLVRHDHPVEAFRDLPDCLGFGLRRFLFLRFCVFFRLGGCFFRLVGQLFYDTGGFFRLVGQFPDRRGGEDRAGRGEQDRAEREEQADSDSVRHGYGLLRGGGRQAEAGSDSDSLSRRHWRRGCGTSSVGLIV